MNESTLGLLLATAASIGFLHTLAGPDHYVPFVAMSRAGGWSLPKTVVITVACGIGHVLGSVVLGMVGIAAGLALSGLEWFEGLRGNLAGWLLLGFGLAYLAWGLRAAIRNRPHSHWHTHANGTTHRHRHVHADAHAHVHADAEKARPLTPWILFTIFVFGPCEPLIPLLMYPAAKTNLLGLTLVTLVFAVATVGTMTVIVIGGTLGLTKVSFSWLQRYTHALAGLAIAVCGGAVLVGL